MRIATSDSIGHKIFLNRTWFHLFAWCAKAYHLVSDTTSGLEPIVINTYLAQTKQCAMRSLRTIDQARVLKPRQEHFFEQGQERGSRNYASSCQSFMSAGDG